ncbi:MAG: class I SAM-dependent methyltransferase [Promethearchaeota archaeon]
MEDQKEHWNNIWKRIQSEKQRNNQPTFFAQKTLEEVCLPENSQILELACGLGCDTKYFLHHGHKVLAVDFSNEALQYLQHHLHSFCKSGKLQVGLFDLSKEFPTQIESIELVYSRLGLHYFTFRRTQELFNLIYQALKPRGWLAFSVRSTNDPLHGSGTFLEPNMFIYKGHVRHFMDKEILLKHYLEKFHDIKLTEQKEHSRVILQCFARKGGTKIMSKKRAISS